MITMEQAHGVDYFHYGDCEVSFGKSGKAVPLVRSLVFRRNGVTKRWKREPERFQVPVKRGLREYGYLRSEEAARWHAEADCPAMAAGKAWWEAKGA